MTTTADDRKATALDVIYIALVMASMALAGANERMEEERLSLENYVNERATVRACADKGCPNE